MKVGLVLSGGGGKGAYELGVWKALKELDIDKYIKVISGTSIGAFNAVLFAQNDIEKAEKLWEEVTIQKLLPIDSKDIIKKGMAIAVGMKGFNLVKKYMPKKLEAGDVPRDGVYEILNAYIDIKKVKEAGVVCYAACTEMPDIMPKYFRINDFDDEEAKSVILASASLPLIYESEEINGRKYLDGGLIDNTPIQPVYGEGCDIIIVVLLSREATINKSLYPNTKIIEIRPSIMKEGVLSGTLNLDEDAKKQRIFQGYEDTMALFDPIIQIAKIQYDDRLKVQNEEQISQRWWCSAKNRIIEILNKDNYITKDKDSIKG